MMVEHQMMPLEPDEHSHEQKQSLDRRLLVELPGRLARSGRRR